MTTRQKLPERPVQTANSAHQARAVGESDACGYVEIAFLNAVPRMCTGDPGLINNLTPAPHAGAYSKP
ncbi:hypothetical protein JF781_20720 [Mycobacterium sp. WUMAC-067]|uniref:hypothetical protein n=1 Tax=unclassified Mycobacterium TaxID=2642494 RepID=UPI001CD97DBF|nr:MULTISPECIES: hypothetical protein [unclassified Mycobacterium]MCA2244784.1 hypothetical protein [Mycobacterium sp. WUMAC-067]MCA2315994.1 hypothetical protein [Mycobacterium sp. WUMAC-025]